MPQGREGHWHGSVTTRQLSLSTWSDFDRLFSAHNGVWGGCWCMFFHATGHFDAGAYEENRRAKRRRVREGKAHGTLVYCGADPIGWCQFGPRGELPRIDKKRGYTPTSEDAWRITCLFVDKGHRRSGTARTAVEASLRAMRALGAGSVEAYPVKGNLSASMLWSGTPELFESQGFTKVRRLGKSGGVYSTKL